MSLGLRRKEKPIWRQVRETKRAGNTGASNCNVGGTTVLRMLVPSSGREEIEQRKVLVFPGEKQARDSDSSRGNIGFQGRESQFHLPETFPPSPNSFQAGEEPLQGREDSRSQGNVRPGARAL